MRLIQIPFSHNCIKVRRALELKGLPYDTLDVTPVDRSPVRAATGQTMVPALQDGDRTILDSTEILRYLERAYTEKPLLPGDPAQHGECWLLEDWADAAFMRVTRRLAYWHRLQVTPNVIAQRFFPGARGLRRWMMMKVARRALVRRFGLSPCRDEADRRELPRVAAVALERMRGRPRFFGDRTTVADVTLAAMMGPVFVTDERLRGEPAVAALLDWARPILGPDVMQLYETL